MEIIVATKTRKSKINQTELELSSLYKQPPGISKEKKKDLVSLCDAKFIPETYHFFLKELNTFPNESVIEDVDNSD